MSPCMIAVSDRLNRSSTVMGGSWNLDRRRISQVKFVWVMLLHTLRQVVNHRCSFPIGLSPCIRLDPPARLVRTVIGCNLAQLRRNVMWLAELLHALIVRSSQANVQK